MTHVLYTAAHGGFTAEAPLGGGAAVFEHLMAEWRRTRPFELSAITPAILGDAAPGGTELARFGERAYARFSRAFERASTAEILKHDPATTVVLVNDISEGPDFATLARRGYRIFTIYHVDVVAYVAAIYGRGRIAPETTVRWYPRLRPLLPDMAALVWEKQQASVEHSRGLIVPSAGMRDVLLRCYPQCLAERIHVLPWGNWNDARPAGDAFRAEARNQFFVPEKARVLLTLSRISPEKGQDLLLEALLDWESSGAPMPDPLFLFLCGEAAFMQGGRFLARLYKLARRLKRTRVIFPGHVTGERKRALLALADLYIFPSRHESYGLTLMEALAAGLPAVCLDTGGARAVMREEFGLVVQPNALRFAIDYLLFNDDVRAGMSAAAREFAAHDRFEDRAAGLARLLLS